MISGPGSRPVDVLMVTWNGLGSLQRCLQSVQQNTRLPFRLLVWDNASTDGTSRWLARQKGVKVFRSPSNLGVARGFNRLMRHARSSVAVRLDDDTVVPPGWMDLLLRPLQRDPSVALVGCKTLTPEGRLRATEFIPPLFSPPLGPDGPQWSYTRLVETVGGACCAFRAEDFRAIKGYTESYSEQQEDIDLGLRLRRGGRRVVCVNGLAVVNRALNRRRPGRVDGVRWRFWKRWVDFPGFPRKDSHEIDFRYLTGWRLYRQGKYRQALRMLHPLRTSPLRDYGAQFLMGLSYRGLGDLQQAREEIRGLVRQRSRVALLAEGNWALEQRAWKAAEKAIAQGIQVFPQEPSFWFLRGKLRASRGLESRAEKDFMRALGRRPPEGTRRVQQLLLDSLGISW